jgi:hypothetical protein
MLGVVLPRDFSRFRTFVLWRDMLSHVLLASLAQAVADGWQGPAHGPTAQQLMARWVGGSSVCASAAWRPRQASGTAVCVRVLDMHPPPLPAPCRLRAALRRLDARAADDFDEEEHGAAAAAVRQQAQAIIQVCVCVCVCVCVRARRCLRPSDACTVCVVCVRE